MFAIIEASGKQYRVEPGQKIVIDRVEAEEGSTLTIDKVLLVGGDGLKVGSPHVAGATVETLVVDHHKGDKVISFRYRKRARTRRKVGFRHSHTTLEIVNINA